MPSSFIRSTIDVRQLRSCPAFAASAVRIASTSTGVAAAEAIACVAASRAVPTGLGAAGAAGSAATAFLPKMAYLILPKMLIVSAPTRKHGHPPQGESHRRQLDYAFYKDNQKNHPSFTHHDTKSAVKGKIISDRVDTMDGMN